MKKWNFSCHAFTPRCVEVVWKTLVSSLPHKNPFARLGDVAALDDLVIKHLGFLGQLHRVEEYLASSFIADEKRSALPPSSWSEIKTTAIQ